MEKTNLGVKPLGRGDVISPTIQAEIKALKEYGEETRAAGLVNNECAAKLHRIATVNYAEALDKIYKTKRADIYIKTYRELKLEI